MNAQEPLEERLLMVKMHEEFLGRIDSAIKKKHSIEACWLCYSCFESRITRSLDKISVACSDRKCFENKRIGIVTKIDCLMRLSRQQYFATEAFDRKLLREVKAWCKKRNVLVHELVTLNNYEGMDIRFLELAKEGQKLLQQLYAQTTEFRNHYYEIASAPPFPQNVINKCRLLKAGGNNAKT